MLTLITVLIVIAGIAFLYGIITTPSELNIKESHRNQPDAVSL